MFWAPILFIHTITLGVISYSCPSAQAVLVRCLHFKIIVEVHTAFHSLTFSMTSIHDVEGEASNDDSDRRKEDSEDAKHNGTADFDIGGLE
jgi:hypothetical protein